MGPRKRAARGKAGAAGAASAEWQGPRPPLGFQPESLPSLLGGSDAVLRVLEMCRPREHASVACCSFAGFAHVWFAHAVAARMPEDIVKGRVRAGRGRPPAAVAMAVRDTDLAAAAAAAWPAHSLVAAVEDASRGLARWPRRCHLHTRLLRVRTDVPHAEAGAAAAIACHIGMLAQKYAPPPPPACHRGALAPLPHRRFPAVHEVAVTDAGAVSVARAIEGTRGAWAPTLRSLAVGRSGLLRLAAVSSAFPGLQTLDLAVCTKAAPAPPGATCMVACAHLYPLIPTRAGLLRQLHKGHALPQGGPASPPVSVACIFWPLCRHALLPGLRVAASNI